MTGSDPKTDLHRYLQDAREALLWKLDGLSEYNIRRPMVPTGTNLLGLIKHVASVELGYFGDCFGRPFSERLPWLEDDAEPNADMWATADESREQITGLYRRAWAHSDATIGTLALDAIGHVPWWPDNRSEVTLHKILVHMIAETDRHAGQADIIRELIDGATGLRNGNDNMAAADPAWWESYRSRLERAAREVGHGGVNQAGAREAGEKRQRCHIDAALTTMMSHRCRMAGARRAHSCHRSPASRGLVPRSAWRRAICGTLAGARFRLELRVPVPRQRGGARDLAASGVEPGQPRQPEGLADDERGVPPAVYHPRRHQLGGSVGDGHPQVTAIPRMR